MAKQPDQLAELQQRVAALELTLRTLRNLPMIRSAVRAYELDCKVHEQERRAREDERRRREAAAPARIRRFERFVQERLELGRGHRCVRAYLGGAGFVDGVYEAWLKAQTDDVPHEERMDETEFHAAMLALPGVSLCTVQTAGGSKSQGYAGVHVAAQWRHTDDARSEKPFVPLDKLPAPERERIVRQDEVRYPTPQRPTAADLRRQLNELERSERAGG